MERGSFGVTLTISNLNRCKEFLKTSNWLRIFTSGGSFSSQVNNESLNRGLFTNIYGAHKSHWATPEYLFNIHIMEMN